MQKIEKQKSTIVGARGEELCIIFNRILNIILLLILLVEIYRCTPITRKGIDFISENKIDFLVLIVYILLSVEIHIEIGEITHGQGIYNDTGHECRSPEQGKARCGYLCL